jgi:hypothetical protein
VSSAILAPPSRNGKCSSLKKFTFVVVHHPAALSLADMIAERNSKIPLALRRK